MSTNHDKYLVLRGKNKDIYFIQKRVSKKVSKIIGKDFIKKSLETSDIKVARDNRYVENDNLEDKIMSNESMSGVSNENAKNITKNSEKDGFLEEYLDMDYIKSLRFPTKDSLIESFDNNLLILLVIGVMIVFFLLN
jgi:hypothetical protein